MASKTTAKSTTKTTQETTTEEATQTIEDVTTTLKPIITTTLTEKPTITEPEVTTTLEPSTVTITDEPSTEPITDDPITETVTDEPITSTSTTSGTTSRESTTNIIHIDTTTKPYSDSSQSSLTSTELNYNDSVVEEYSSNVHLCEDGIVEDVIYEDFQIHFIETGVYKTGDVIYIKAGETDIMVDAGPSTSTISDITNYIDKFCTDGVLEYVVVTHSHSDHWAGMYGSSSSNNGILYKYQVGTLIHFAQTNKTSTASTTEYGKYLAAVGYAQNRGTEVYTAAQCFNNEDGAQSEYILDSEGDMKMTILYNY